MSHLPYKEDQQDTGPNYGRIAHIGFAAVFAGYRSVLGWLGLFVAGTGIALMVMSPMLATENDNPRIREQDIRGETIAICKKLPGAFDGKSNVISNCMRDPQAIGRATKASYEKFPIKKSQPLLVPGFFLALIGVGIVLGLWLPATLASKALDAVENR